MSAAIASAKRRRAPAQEPPKPPTNISSDLQQQQPAGGLTLQQVITILNSRVLALEDYVKGEKSRPITDAGLTLPKDSSSDSEIMSNTNQLPIDIVDEFNERFLLLAQEIANLKDMLLSLQTYTMSINKTLMEERINILSEINMANEPLHLDKPDDAAEPSVSSSEVSE
jgi:uncharacterized small protein (DUF1192 family)